MKNITLEMSLKPFRRVDDEYIEKVCTYVFEQWRPLLKNAETVSVMLWTADGSEILDYRGNFDDEINWSCYAGNANPDNTVWHTDHDPDGISVHCEGYYYTNDVPVMTYSTLKKIIVCLKETGMRITGKKVLVGATFDVGPEFANSDFKYNRHREICTGNAMGPQTMVCCYEKLHGDDVSYAGFPDGIPEGTPFGTFFGRQTRIFLDDMGMDYIWFSNGLGFGRETWSCTGDIFDGEEFHPEKLDIVKDSMMEFWKLFRDECPEYQIRVRGTNMTVGIDMASDGVPLKAIYDNVDNLLPPPNSPWAALDGDYGLELTGYMSRMSEVPDGDYLFRYYLHDPWWVNSPWYDRYGGQPHDIYLPMSIGRMDENGKMCAPSHMHLLSIDNAWGEFPDACANEPIPHLIKAIKDAPDAPSPVMWVYPFREYNMAKGEKILGRMYHLDWYIRGCINNGVPVSGVVSTDNFMVVDKSLFNGSILITPVPVAGSEFESEIMKYAADGGKVIFIGDIDDASDKFMTFAGIKKTDGISGEAEVMTDGVMCGKIKHDVLLNSGEVNTVGDGGEVFAEMGGKAIGVMNGSCIWLRATVSSERIKYSENERLPRPHCDKEYFISERLMLTALSKFGLYISYEKPYGERMPVTMISRYDNAFMYSVYTPSTTVKTTFGHKLGAPVIIGYRTVLENGKSTYHFPQSVHGECRVFVEQESGIVGAREWIPCCYIDRRCIEVTGLQNATVRYFPEEYCKDNARVLLDSFGCGITSKKYESEVITDEFGTYTEIRNVTGKLTLLMPDVKHNGVIKQPDRKHGKHCKTGEKYTKNIAFYE